MDEIVTAMNNSIRLKNASMRDIVLVSQQLDIKEDLED